MVNKMKVYQNANILQAKVNRGRYVKTSPAYKSGFSQKPGYLKPTRRHHFEAERSSAEPGEVRRSPVDSMNMMTEVYFRERVAIIGMGGIICNQMRHSTATRRTRKCYP